MIWFLVPPSRSIRSVPATRSISLVSACGRMLCAVFVSSFSCDVPWRRVVSFSLSSRHSSRRLVSWGVSWLFFAARSSARFAHQFAWRLAASSRIAHRSPSCLMSRLSVSLVVLRCFALPGSSFLVSCSRLVCSSRQAVRILSFRSAARGAFRVFSVPTQYLVISCSCFISLVAFHGHDGGGSSFSSRCGVFPSRCPVVGSDWAMMGTGWVCRLTIRGTRRFIQLDFSISAGMK